MEGRLGGSEPYTPRMQRQWLDLLSRVTTKSCSPYLLDSDDEQVDVGNLTGDLQIPASPLGHRGLVVNVERELVAEVLDELNPAKRR